MTDYGHELEFGTFLTPSSQRPDAVVRLALATEESGLDLVTFQDHPYQPAFLDTWTLMSYVAARTRRVRISANVLNLPLRGPAVLARSAASLDLLSGGRTELGIGAGAFWDAIEAMGGRRLAPGQAVDALAEAIEVIRLVWDTSARGGVRVAGSYYRVAGAKRGPAPAHDIGIWVGAYKPRMLRLTGRLADGWLPSLGYIQPGQLAEANAVIDEAAAGAGRDPASVRRLLNIGGEFSASGGGLLNGPPAEWAEQLAEIALADGVGTFILGSDDEDVIRRFAAEVAPAVRELVTAGRVGGETRHGAAATGPAALSTGRPRGTAGDGTAGDGTAGDGAAVLGVTPTPDDGTRLSSRRLWDETARPTRPPSPPGTRYTDTGRAAGGHLVQVHDALRAELGAVRDLISQVEKGVLSAGQARSELNRMTLRQNAWTMGAYCQSYCRVVTGHHGLEDQAIFPHLRAREPGLGPVLDRLAEEHLAIHGVLDAVDRVLVGLASHPADTGALREAADLLADTLLSHLAYEERELVEPLARHGFYDGQV